MTTTTGRLLSLDVMRGLTILIMIMVNNQLWGTHIFDPLEHVAWNGLKIADLVFPWFMMIMGVSVAYSLRRFDYRPSKAAVVKIVRRTCLIFLIGLALDYFDKGLSGVIEGLDFTNLRLMGVLPRLALSYGFAAILALLLDEKGVKWATGIFLVLYAIVLLSMNGYEPSTNNIVARVDLAILGESHMYHDWVPERIALDPEGLLGTIPSIAHVLIGYLMGRMLLRERDNYARVTNLMLCGALLALAGYILAGWLPVNKKIWSPTFVLASCGLGSQMLGLLIWIIDIKGYKNWTHIFAVFGVNPLALYVLSSLLGAIIWNISIGDRPLPSLMYSEWLSPMFGEQSGMPSLIYSLMIVVVCWLTGYVLWRKKIYIKL